MKVLGIDPGAAAVGYGVVVTDRPGRLGRLEECGVIRTSAREPLAERLLTIHQGLQERGR